MKTKKRPKRVIDSFSSETETALCVIVAKPVARIIEDLLDTGLWGKNIPEVCDRIISTWIRENLDHLVHLGIKLKVD